MTATANRVSARLSYIFVILGLNSQSTKFHSGQLLC